MIGLTELRVYFPNIGKPIEKENYTFTISLNDETNAFSVNLKITQKDTKKEHLVKFKLGLEKHFGGDSNIHNPKKPHFQVDIYERKEDSFSALLYFTFEDVTDNLLLDYAKGTIVLIEKILENFIKTRGLDEDFLNELIYKEPVLDELIGYEKILIDALYECFKMEGLVVRDGKQEIIIKTSHNLKKFLGQSSDLEPLYLPLMEKVEKNHN